MSAADVEHVKRRGQDAQRQVAERRLLSARSSSKGLLIAGLLLSTLGWGVGEAFLHYQDLNSNMASRYLARDNPALLQSLRDAEPQMGGRAGGVFWLGIAFIALSQIKAIEVAVRENGLRQESAGGK